MGRRSDVSLVVLVAASAGLVLAPLASAGPSESTASQTSAAPAPPMPVASTDEPEAPDDSRATTGDNPYDEPGGHPGLVKRAVIAKDGMLRIPGGRFTMGSSSAKAPPNERPAHGATVAPFWIDRTEVSVGAYKACVDGGACAAPARSSATCTYDAGDAELPVSCVHWQDADDFCRFSGKRLPTEAEWEYAARGTYKTAFPWGPLAACANAVTLVNDQTARTCLPRPAHVGAHPAGASVFGVMDLSGNVEEWTADWYVESLGPGAAPRAGAAHVLRGGGWLSVPSMSRTTTRNWGSALEAGANVGFRCAKTAD